jgi:hypothetical protein
MVVAQRDMAMIPVNVKSRFFIDAPYNEVAGASRPWHIMR